MGIFGLLAFAGGAGLTPIPAALAAGGLLLALFWHPSPSLSARMERIWLPLAVLLVARALYHVVVVGDDVVLPVVDLLLLLLTAEALRSLDAGNDARLYALSFALLLASTAYRPGALFAIAFVGFVATGTVALLVGHLRRETEQHRSGEVPVSSRFLLGIAGLSVLVLTVSAVVFLSFPRVSQGWVGRGNPPAAPMAGFSEVVSLGSHGATIQPNPTVLLRVEFPEGRPVDVNNLYWRGRSYDRFDGVRWTRSRALPAAAAPISWYEQRWGGAPLVQQVYAANLESRVIFGLHPTVDVRPESRIQPALDNAGDLIYWGSGSPAYTVRSLTGRPDPEALRRGSSSGFTPARSFYTQLPPTLSPRVRALADSLTADLPGRYDRVAAIQGWFHTQFGYTMELPRTARETSLEYFLFQRMEGHCEYFSSAMVMLLRTLGIPARQVNGFLGGDWNEFGGYLAVTGNQAHSWVEVWFPEHGWVPFDPTPAGGPAAARAAGPGFRWPGRFFLDGIHHRWSKWILDYSVARQWDLMNRLSGAFAGADSEQDGAGGEGGRDTSFLWGGLLLLALLVGLGAFLVRREATGPPESVLYLRLRGAYAARGLPSAKALPPLAFLEAARGEGMDGVTHAEQVVGLYLRSRFGGAPLSPEERQEMVVGLRRARRALRRSGRMEERGK